MRVLVVKCDVCNKPVDDFNGGITLAAGWGEIARADACSHECVLALLRGFLKGLEERGAKTVSDNAAFKKEHPEATPIPHGAGAGSGHAASTSVTVGSGPGWSASAALPPSPAVSLPAPIAPAVVAVGCAACDRGVEVNVDTAHTHTGEGKLCKTPIPTSRMIDGPCTCPTTGWTIDPKDDKPGPHVVTCSQCTASWSVTLRSVEETEKKGKGRPAGSKNKKTLAAEAAAAAVIPAETPENKAQRDAALGRTPEASIDELERLKASREAPAATPVAPTLAAPVVNQPIPGENISQLVTDLAKLGLTLNLIEVMQWTSMQRDLARSWAMHPEFEPPEFLVEIARAKITVQQATQQVTSTSPAAPPSPAVSPTPAATLPAGPPKSRFSFT